MFGPAAFLFPDFMNTQCQAVFLHTGYRTAGTWLWSCFRQLDNVTAYYEPLHEMLATIDQQKLESSTANSWRSGHPALEAPYFAEFAHLLRAGERGIPGYDAVFSVDRLDGETPQAAERLEAYVRGLMQSAHQQGRVPVLKFCRSLGRLQWFRAMFPDAVHVVVEKNPLSQWQSCWQLFAAHRNPHFVAIPFVVLALNRHVPLVQQTMDALGVVLLPESDHAAAPTVEAHLALYKEHIAAITPLQAYRAFLAHWLLTLRDAHHADAIFDCDLAGHSPAYIAGAERWINELTGLEPSFGSARREEAAERDHGFGAAEGLQLHLDTLNFARTLMVRGTVAQDALHLWASKLAQASQTIASGVAPPRPQQSQGTQPQVEQSRTTRMMGVALLEGAGIDEILLGELAATRALLADVRSELARLQRSPLLRLVKRVRRLRAPKLLRRMRRAGKPRRDAGHPT